MKKVLIAICIIVSIIGLRVVGVLFGWFDTYAENKIEYIDQKIDDATNYETRKNVEDSCRAMISSYEADKLTWEQYKDSDGSEQRSWADQAKMRANRTASTYNNYILKNSYVWDGNVPDDILYELETLK